MGIVYRHAQQVMEMHKLAVRSGVQGLLQHHQLIKVWQQEPCTGFLLCIGVMSLEAATRGTLTGGILRKRCCCGGGAGASAALSIMEGPQHVRSDIVYPQPGKRHFLVRQHNVMYDTLVVACLQ
mmetsp:Transcript_24253/g.53011  ORF Transcript_24253/g.53011 Transcript_24253/m.53011 type:complete len:124 (+) Transcript_24253:685-1056(+)